MCANTSWVGLILPRFLAVRQEEEGARIKLWRLVVSSLLFMKSVGDPPGIKSFLGAWDIQAYSDLPRLDIHNPILFNRGHVIQTYLKVQCQQSFAQSEKWSKIFTNTFKVWKKYLQSKKNQLNKSITLFTSDTLLFV